MDPLIGGALWIIFFLLAGAGSAAKSAAETTRAFRSDYFTLRSAPLDRLDFWGRLIGALGLGGVAAMTVLLAQVLGTSTVATVLGTGVVVLATIYFQKLTEDIARARFRQIAAPFLGDLTLLPQGTLSTTLNEEPVEQVVDAVEKAGLIEMDEHQMITGIIHLDRTHANDIMVPRLDLVAIDVDSSFRQALDLVIHHGVSRVPVYEGTIDRIEGVLYARDLLEALRDGKTDADLRSLLRPAQFVPESKRLDELLQELQKTKVHMAIVVDEYGGTAGIVTIEDILEEIVGEIRDEYDTREEPLVERMSGNEAIFNARAPLHEVNHALEVNLPDQSDTLGGLVLMHLEKMPKVGDQIRVGDVSLTVTSVIGRRITKVRVAKGNSGAIS